MVTLVVTVGGSAAPVATVVRSMAPKRVVYLCSGGDHPSTDMVAGPGAEVPTLSGRPLDLAVDQVVLLDDLDDLAACYLQIAAVLREEIRMSPAAGLVADYTGGTKTMAAALVLAATDLGVGLALTSGERTDLQAVHRGEATSRVDTTRIHAGRVETAVALKWQRFSYGEAACLVRGVLNNPALDGDSQRRLERIAALSEGFDAWDRFDHAEAQRLLRPVSSGLGEAWAFLRRVVAARCQPRDEPVNGLDRPGDGTSANGPGSPVIHGMELVEDLLANAARRAATRRFDDAVGRLYRAFELAAQVRLREVAGVETAAVEVDELDLTGSQQDRWRAKSAADGVLRIGSLDAYLLLEQLGDPLGVHVTSRRPEYLGFLAIRNHSLFAHGLRSIEAAQWHGVDDVVGAFLRVEIRRRCDGHGVVRFKQLPQEVPS